MYVVLIIIYMQNESIILSVKGNMDFGLILYVHAHVYNDAVYSMEMVCSLFMKPQASSLVANIGDLEHCVVLSNVSASLMMSSLMSL